MYCNVVERALAEMRTAATSHSGRVTELSAMLPVGLGFGVGGLGVGRV